MLVLKGDKPNFPDQLNLKEFRSLFEMSRFGTVANEKIEEEFRTHIKEFSHKQFVQIIGHQLKQSED